jgi:ubiquinone/menaquinone biosynthesis C-methylase UbiE
MITRRFLSLFAPLATGAVALLRAQQPGSPAAKGLIAPFVSSPQEIVTKMLEAGKLKPGETLYDLGSGDGRIVLAAAQQFRAKAVGVELSERLARYSADTISKLGLEKQASVLHADIFEVDLSPANVVTLYLMRDANDLLRPKLERELKPGARVVSHDYEIRSWKPVAVEQVEAYKRTHNIFVYAVPSSFRK